VIDYLCNVFGFKAQYSEILNGGISSIVTPVQNEVRDSVYLKRRLAAKAFHLLKEANVQREGNGFKPTSSTFCESSAKALANNGVSWPTFEAWLASYVIPDRPPAFVRILWDVLDDDGAQYLCE
jgi:hypothetical protein